MSAATPGGAVAIGSRPGNGPARGKVTTPVQPRAGRTSPSPSPLAKHRPPPPRRPRPRTPPARAGIFCPNGDWWDAGLAAGLSASDSRHLLELFQRHVTRWRTPSAGAGPPATRPSGTTARPSTTPSTTTATCPAAPPRPVPVRVPAPSASRALPPDSGRFFRAICGKADAADASPRPLPGPEVPLLSREPHWPQRPTGGHLRRGLRGGDYWDASPCGTVEVRVQAAILGAGPDAGNGPGSRALHAPTR
jgi:hypothetical protein